MFVRDCWVYWRPRLLCLVGVVVYALLNDDVGRPFQWGSFAASHGPGSPG